MNNLLKYIFFIITLTTFSSSTLAMSSEWSISEVSKVRLISPLTNTDNKKEITLGLEYILENGWKTYWKSPGDGGFPQNLIWKESENVKKINLEWPTPQKFQILGLDSIGYESEVIFPLTVEIIDPNKDIFIDLSINYLVCKDICVPGDARVFLNIPSGKSNTTEFFHSIEKALSSLPNKNINFSSLKKSKINAFEKEKEILIEFNLSSKKKFDNPNIFLHTPFGLPVKNSIKDYSIDYKELIASFYFDKKMFSEKSFNIEAILVDKNHNEIFKDNVKLEKQDYSYFYDNLLIFYFLTALIGGLILNIMPCVFPVLSIKLLSVLENNKKNTRISFLITSFGIISSFIILAVIFLILRQLNVSISWGMQFQEPYFLLVITFILSLFMLNLFNQFEFQLPQFILSSKLINITGNKFSKDFFNGFFATLLATPCSAPFVGTAITAAFTQHPIIFLAIFTFMGLGMSIPYLVIAAFPFLVSFLPKPGQWMIYTKYLLGFFVLLTLFWLFNILSNFFNINFIYASFSLLILFVLLLKIKFNKIIISLIIFCIFLSLPSFQIFKSNINKQFEENWINLFSVDINNLLDGNNIVFLDITADWCATCQFNKINVLNKKNVMNFFENNNIKLVKADWTVPDKRINIFLKKYDKYGIPFNAIFSNTHPEGIVLSELLSESEIFKIINELKYND